MLSGDIPPNQTIYLKNLNEKIKKEELKRSLYALFSQYGRILDVVALKTPRLRGQAWIAFSEVPAASNAVRQMQNFPFYDKPIRIQYAKTKSDCIAKADGSFVPRDKKKKQEEKAERKRRPDDAPPSAAANGTRAENGATPAPFRQGNTSAQEAAAPNNILFIENLPHETTSMMLELLFQQYPGFREVRIIEAKPGIAFVEFEDDVQSSMAMQALQGFKITPQNPMAITFAKKSSRNFTKTLSNESGKPIGCKEEMKECYVMDGISWISYPDFQELLDDQLEKLDAKFKSYLTSMETLLVPTSSAPPTSLEVNNHIDGPLELEREENSSVILTGVVYGVDDLFGNTIDGSEAHLQKEQKNPPTIIHYHYSQMKRLKKDIENRDPNPNMTNPFDIFTDEIVYAILDHLHGDPFSKRSFSSVCKSFYFIESRHRRALKPLRSDLLPRTFRRYSSISHLDLSLCSLVDDNNLAAVSVAWKSTLRSINLSRSRAFSSIGLLTLVSNCSGLVEIDLSNGTELTDSAAKAIAEARNLEILRLSRCKSITDIGIGCIAITEKCLSHILQLQHLEDLILEGCHGIDDNGLSTLNHTCKSIKMINMSNCQSLSYIGLSSLTNGANSLEQLILANGPSVTSDLAKCLSQFSSLRSIKLDGCLVTCSGINSIANWSASLVELSFSKCSGLTDECLCFLAERHKELRKLDITCCRKITIASIEGITKSCTSLTSLRMESCSLVSKEAFVLIGQHCQMLEDLDVTDNEMDDEGLKAISRCSRLQSLKLGICLNMTDEGLIHVGRGCSKLKELDLYRCAGVTDRGIEAIGHGCPALEMINIAYNSKITDTSLISLSKCSSLKVLEIRGCPHISSVGLSSIAMECRQLSELDIKKCFNINDNAMHPLGKFSQNLQQINLSYCSVTDAGLLSVTRINRLRNMTILHLSGLTPNGLAAALLTCGGLTKVKLHSSFKPLLPQYIYKYMESRGCVFHWRNKAFQEEIDPKGWQLHLGRPS
ncbi:hypothetical protein F8388_009683 [Cannabis sativa]|uniref:RRM domain-containing protein n=1 Tax=Cannabis sativa TaxID=3483 RepID=A0A7J6H4Q7_CANSA|nr:hypothetical protein F8388_009683 [Cannabis sativa]